MFSIIPSSNQKTQTCAVVSPLDDQLLEVTEQFTVGISSQGEGNVVVIQGAETLNVLIEDDEGQLNTSIYIAQFSNEDLCLLSLEFKLCNN